MKISRFYLHPCDQCDHVLHTAEGNLCRLNMRSSVTVRDEDCPQENSEAEADD